MTNDKYYNWYEDLSNELGRAYQDSCILQSIDRLSNNKIDKSHPGFHIVSHLCELAKRDIALTLYKIWFDNESKETIKKFNVFSRELGSQKRIKLKLSGKEKEIEKELETLRNKYLAHIDSINEKVSVDVDVMTQVLKEITQKLSDIGDNTIDERITPISMSSINLELSTQLGMLSITKDFINKEE